MKTPLQELNSLPIREFVHRLGGTFEHSPWVAEKAAEGRPYSYLDALHAAMVQIVQQSGEKTQLQLLNAHPDLVSRTILTA